MAAHLPMHCSRGCSKRAASAPWQCCTSMVPPVWSGGVPVQRGGLQPSRAGMLQKHHGLSKSYRDMGKDTVPTGEPTAVPILVPVVVPNMVSSVVPIVVVFSVVPVVVPLWCPLWCTDRAAPVLLLQVGEARSRDKGPEPEARQEVTAGAPVCRALGRAGLPGHVGPCCRDGSWHKGIRMEQPEGSGRAGQAGHGGTSARACCGPQPPGGTICLPGWLCPRLSSTHPMHQAGALAQGRDPWAGSLEVQRTAGSCAGGLGEELRFLVDGEGCRNGLLSAESSSGEAGTAAPPPFLAGGWQHC